MKLKVLMISMLISMFTIISCDNGSGSGSAEGSGGPEKSPENFVPEEDTLNKPATDEDLPLETDTSTSRDSEVAKDDAEITEDEELIDELVVPSPNLVSGEDEFSDTVLGEDTDDDAADDDSETVSTDATSDDESAPSEETASADDSGSGEETTSTEESDSEEETSSTKESGSAEKTASTDESDSEEETSSAEETASADESASDEETESSEETESASQEGEAETDSDEELAAEDSTESEDPSLVLQGVSLDVDFSQNIWKLVDEERLAYTQTDEYKTLQAERKELVAKLKVLKQQIEAETNKKRKSELKEEKRALALEIKAIREELGYGKVQRGIYSTTADTPLELTVDDITKEGWYTLKVDAKNIFGPLPDSYEYFNITVTNNVTGENLGGMQIAASDEKYQRGNVYVYLKEGTNKLTLTWTNDAFKQNEFDTNIQIGRIRLNYKEGLSRRYEKGIRTAAQYSEVDGRFFWDSSSVYTYWPDQTIGFEFFNLEPGKYKILVWAKNYGELPVPKNYKFSVDVDTSSGESTVLEIKPNEKKYKRAIGKLNLSGGDTVVYLTWTNDVYVEGKTDSNIQIKKVQLVKVGERDTSLGAYLLGTRAGNSLILLGVILVLTGVVLTISYRHRDSAV